MKQPSAKEGGGDVVQLDEYAEDRVLLRQLRQSLAITPRQEPLPRYVLLEELIATREAAKTYERLSAEHDRAASEAQHRFEFHERMRISFAERALSAYERVRRMEAEQ